MSESGHARYQSPEIGLRTWNAAIVIVVNFTGVFPALIRQNDCCEKGLFENFRYNVIITFFTAEILI